MRRKSVAEQAGSGLSLYSPRPRGSLASCDPCTSAQIRGCLRSVCLIHCHLEQRGFSASAEKLRSRKIPFYSHAENDAAGNSPSWRTGENALLGGRHGLHPRDPSTRLLSCEQKSRLPQDDRVRKDRLLRTVGQSGSQPTPWRSCEPRPCSTSYRQRGKCSRVDNPRTWEPAPCTVSARARSAGVRTGSTSPAG